MNELKTVGDYRAYCIFKHWISENFGSTGHRQKITATNSSYLDQSFMPRLPLTVLTTRNET